MIWIGTNGCVLSERLRALGPYVVVRIKIHFCQMSHYCVIPEGRRDAFLFEISLVKDKLGIVGGKIFWRNISMC